MARLRALLGGKAHGGVATSAATAGELRQAHSLLRDYEKSGLGWFWSTDPEGRIVYISDIIAGKLGRQARDLVGEPFHALFVLDAEGDSRAERTLPLIFTARKTFAELQVRAARGDGEALWLSISGRPQHDASGTFTGFHGNGADITARRQTERDASRLEAFDRLTGLANRHAMGKRLATMLPAFRAAQRSCALLMIDLDRFKQVNDTLGHAAGDELLKQVAQRLARVIPKAPSSAGSAATSSR